MWRLGRSKVQRGFQTVQGSGTARRDVVAEPIHLNPTELQQWALIMIFSMAGVLIGALSVAELQTEYESHLAQF